MKRSLEILMDEHRHIERACRVLCAMAKVAEEKGEVSTNDWKELVDFIREFADKCHHGKEEDQLFVMLRQKGIPVEHGPLGVMLSEHDVGRDFVKGMVSSLEGAGKRDAEARKMLVDSARGYAALLAQHIWKEDNILYRIADDILSDEDEKVLLERYGEGSHEKFLASLERLAKQYGEEALPMPEDTGHGCMGCH